jgi:hypothetical protein
MLNRRAVLNLESQISKWYKAYDEKNIPNPGLMYF